jgi:hypothetical protein
VAAISYPGKKPGIDLNSPIYDELGRKAAAHQLAENKFNRVRDYGCHAARDLEGVSRKTTAASQPRLAQSAMSKLAGATGEQTLANQGDGFVNTPAKSLI